MNRTLSLSTHISKRHPQILEDEELGEEATKLFADAKLMIERFIENDTIQAHAVFGIFPAGTVNGNHSRGCI